MDDDLKARAYVEAMYPGSRWSRRVRRMTSEQVVAIFLKEQKKKEDHESNPKELGACNEPPTALSTEEFTQPALWGGGCRDGGVDSSRVPSDPEGGGSSGGVAGADGAGDEDRASRLF